MIFYELPSFLLTINTSKVTAGVISGYIMVPFTLQNK